MTCLPINIESAQHCDQLEAKTSGINAVVQIIPVETIKTFPSIGTVPEQSNISITTEMEKLVSIGGDIELANNKTSIFLPSEIEKNGLAITGQKGAYTSTLTIKIQNTTYNRGVVAQLKKLRFVAIVKDLATGDKIILGRHLVYNSQYAAKLNPEINIDFGDSFDSERDISLSIVAKKFMPSTFYGRIKESTLFENTNRSGIGDLSTIGKVKFNPFQLISVKAWEDGNESSPLTPDFEVLRSQYGILDPNDDNDEGWMLTQPITNSTTAIIIDPVNKNVYYNDLLTASIYDDLEDAVDENLLFEYYDEF